MVKGFLISDLLAVVFFFGVGGWRWGAYSCSEAVFCQGTALFDVMTVLACLSAQTTVTRCTCMRPRQKKKKKKQPNRSP